MTEDKNTFDVDAAIERLEAAGGEKLFRDAALRAKKFEEHLRESTRIDWVFFRNEPMGF